MSQRAFVVSIVAIVVEEMRGGPPSCVPRGGVVRCSAMSARVHAFRRASPGLLLLVVACGGRVESSLGSVDAAPPEGGCHAGCLCITDRTTCAAAAACCPTDTLTGFLCENGACGSGGGVEDAGTQPPSPPSPPAPGTCTSQGLGLLVAPGGGCGGALTSESCSNGMQYSIECNCPNGTCTCSEQSGQGGSSSSSSVSFSGCTPDCSGSNFVPLMFQSCGFPMPSH